MNKFSAITLLVMVFCGTVLMAQTADKPAVTADELRGAASPSEAKKTEPPKEQKSPDVQQSQINESTDSAGNGTAGQVGGDKANAFEYKSYNSFGLNISSHSGIGLSYRYHLDSPVLFQISGGVISEGESYFYAVGAEVQRELSKSKDKRAFGSFAFGIYGEREKEVYDVGYSTGMNPPEKWVSKNAYSFALGVGGELALGSSIVDSLTLGCEIYPVGIYLEDSGDSRFNMFPGAAVYLFYNF